ncbi:MAG: family N-acetyltransferase [Ilumatobacteraceae bacterium]|nr:family N-acetyltransferase [Ilumatobacteraceae bacterium]MCU1389066.1 family N-acetyltransferase [Ilumatobacteraceae bacterium]
MGRSDLIVREAAAADARRIIELIAMGAVAPTEPDLDGLRGTAAALVEIAATDGSAVLVIESERRVVGVCQLIVFRHISHGGGLCAEIESMHVDPTLRGRGVGSVLLAAAVDRARTLGCHRVQLTSNKARTDAHRFYVRHGFTATHEGFKLVFG